MPSAADPGMLMTPVPLWMSNCDDPGSGSDQRTVPGSAQCREPPVQVRADEPDSGDAGGAGEDDEQAVIVTVTATASAAPRTGSRRRMRPSQHLGSNRADRSIAGHGAENDLEVR